MRFPGQRKSKHYFPVADRAAQLSLAGVEEPAYRTHVVGIDQTLVDIEAHVPEDLVGRYDLSKGHSLVLAGEAAEALYEELREQRLITQQFAGGTIGNTLHNYSVLADDPSILLGVMSRDIRIGTYAYRYLCNTSSRMNLDYLQPVDGPIGRCFALITADGERTFAISEGKMNQLRPESVPEHVFEGASALLVTSYLMRCADEDPMPAAALRAIECAKRAGVPVVLTLGTKWVVADRPAFWREFIDDHVNVLAMNEEEAGALTGCDDPLLACDQALELVDLALCTTGPSGLYLAGYTDQKVKRQTKHPLLPGAIPEFNQLEFSRPMLRSACDDPIRVYSHIAPYMGGPARINNTNGAGDGALAALLHDISANRYHRFNVPGSAKHAREFLTYSSFAQVCKYANRVSYEVLVKDSPRLHHGLPDREASLEEAYWSR
ncbi:MAG: inosine/guanosine kinase [Deltaproteobacteria bacterium]|nr:MAG: inosine/guanosine kinase [Deltaproteobacteria bacterium]